MVTKGDWSEKIQTTASLNEKNLTQDNVWAAVIIIWRPRDLCCLPKHRLPKSGIAKYKTKYTTLTKLARNRLRNMSLSLPHTLSGRSRRLLYRTHSQLRKLAKNRLRNMSLSLPQTLSGRSRRLLYRTHSQLRKIAKNRLRNNSLSLPHPLSGRSRRLLYGIHSQLRLYMGASTCMTSFYTVWSWLVQWQRQRLSGHAKRCLR